MDLTGRSLFISDIHGQLDVLRALLVQADYDPQRDRLVLSGDYVGKGPDNLSCLSFLANLKQKTSVIALMGNHELNLWHCVQRRPMSSTQEERYPYAPRLAEQIKRHNPEVIAFLADLDLWYADDSVIAVHAGINPRLNDWRSTSVEELTSMREPFLSESLPVQQTVIFGHTPCQRLHGSPDVWFGTNKIGIDGGAGHGIQLNCLIWDRLRFSAISVPCRT